MRRILLWVLSVCVLLLVFTTLAFYVSPWPRALLVRAAFDRDTQRITERLNKHVPDGVASRLNLHYDTTDSDAYLDVYFPVKAAVGNQRLPTLVWIHGGGWVSGDKAQISQYARIIAKHGYTVVSIDYSLAPGATYPTPVLQANRALMYLVDQAAALHIDPQRLFLAGDSAGAQIAAVLANGISIPAYAQQVGFRPGIARRQLAGVVLFCGPYDFRHVNLDGDFGSFLRTVLWSYSGQRDFMNSPHFMTGAVLEYVSPAFPPTFISVGNADPLAPQSRALAERLSGLGVPVDTLFFPADFQPGLPHEYQFNLDTPAGQSALAYLLAFLARYSTMSVPAADQAVPATHSGRMAHNPV